MDRTSISSRAARWAANPTAAPRSSAGLHSSWRRFMIGGAVGTETIADEDLGNGDSRQADQIVADAGYPEDDYESVLVQSKSGATTDDSQFQAAISDTEQRLAQVAHVADIESPLKAQNADQVSADGRSALIEFQLRGTDEQMSDRVEAPLAAAAEAQDAHPEFTIEEFGGASAEAAVDEALAEDFQRAEFLSLPITLLILVVAFGALVAAGVPLLLGLTAVFATLGIRAGPSQLFPVDERISSVILLIGLAVGVDYSLFYLRREREERRAGHANEAALAIAAATSGRAVLVSGLTVMIAMAGMFLDRRHAFIVVRGRDDPGRRGRDARLADGPAGDAVEARRPGREGPRAVHASPAPRRRRRVARLGGDPRPRAAAAAHVGGAGRWAAGRARDPGLGMNTAD